MIDDNFDLQIIKLVGRGPTFKVYECYEKDKEILYLLRIE